MDRLFLIDILDVSTRCKANISAQKETRLGERNMERGRRPDHFKGPTEIKQSLLNRACSVIELAVGRRVLRKFEDKKLSANYSRRLARNCEDGTLVQSQPFRQEKCALDQIRPSPPFLFSSSSVGSVHFESQPIHPAQREHNLKIFRG